MSFCSCNSEETFQKTIKLNESSKKAVVRDTILVLRDSCQFTDGELLRFIGQIEECYLLTLHGEDWKKSWSIYDNANKYKNEALSLISCSNFSEINRDKIISLMNGMGYDNYMEFIYEAYDLFCKMKISTNDLQKIMFNGWGRRYYLSKY